MKASELEYGKEYRHVGMPDRRLAYLGGAGNRFWFVAVKGEYSTICSGKMWMNADQVQRQIQQL